MSSLHYATRGRVAPEVAHVCFRSGAVDVLESRSKRLEFRDPVLEVTRSGRVLIKDTSQPRSLKLRLLAERDPGWQRPPGSVLVGQPVMATPFVAFVALLTLPRYLRERREIARERAWHVDRFVKDARDHHVQTELS